MQQQLVKRNLRMKCPNYSHWNRFSVNKIFIEQPNPIEPKVKVLIPMYEPLKTETCKKCKRVIAKRKELVRIQGRYSSGENGKATYM